MISYLVIDRIEEKIAVCEVELIEIDESKEISFLDKETVMSDIPVELFEDCGNNLCESDVYVVEHENGNVRNVLFKDDTKKQSRIDQIRAIRNQQ